jgi:hypothetical protein
LQQLFAPKTLAAAAQIFSKNVLLCPITSYDVSG